MIPDIVQRLARLPAPRALATIAIAATADTRDTTATSTHSEAVELHLERAWPNRPGHLLLDYSLPDGSHVAGQWFARSRHTGGCTRSSLEQLARKTAGTTPEPHAVTIDLQHGVLLQAGGADRRLADLARLVRQDGARLVAHRPERRGVVRLTNPVRWVKVVRPGRGPTTTLPATPDHVRVPEMLHQDRTRTTTTWSDVEGRSLHDLLRSGLEPARQIAVGRAVGAAIRYVHELEPTGLDRHAPDDEIAVVTTWGQRLANHLDHDPAAQRLPRLRTRFATSDPMPRSTLHRDLHDKQILLDERNRVGMIDFDTSAVGEAALDVANLLIHLELRARQQRADPASVDAIGAAILAGYGWPARHTDRLLAYAASARLRLSAVYAFRPRWAHVSDALLDNPFGPPPGLH